MTQFHKNKYAHLVCILLVIIINCSKIYGQNRLHSFVLFTRETADSYISKINTNEDEILLLEEVYSPSSTFNIISVKKDTFQVDTVEKFLLKYSDNEDDNRYYYPTISATSLYYIKDTLFISFKYGIATYKKQRNHFILDNITYFSNNELLSDIIGINNTNLILGNQYFSSSKYYRIALYDFNTKTIQNIVQMDMNNSIMFHYYDSYNAFASNNKYVSVINIIEPKIYLFDYNLNLIDSIDFSFNLDYKITKSIVDTNFIINQTIVQPNLPKNIIMILDSIGIQNYYANVKQTFVNDSILLVLTQRMKVDSCDLIKVNIQTKQSEIILSFPKYGMDSPYVPLFMGSMIPIFKHGYFVDYNTKLDEEEENIIYSLDLYYSKTLDFDTDVILLEDRKENIVEVNPKNYDGIIVFDEYLCKVCFSNKLKNSKLLFIYYKSGINKINRLTLYKDLKSIYPNAEIFFNHNNNFSVKRNVIVNSL
ncbi:MAG: hypothetical protein IJ759_07675 [Bacteroidales bacterium]|nr:hypothetical protein [Bacteroidales bacterium]